MEWDFTDLVCTRQHENMNSKFHALFKLALIETDWEKMTSAPILGLAEQMILGIHVFQSFLEFSLTNILCCGKTRPTPVKFISRVY